MCIRDRILNSLIIKCWEDESFKNELVASPTQTFEKFAKIPVNLPEGVQLIVNDQTNKMFVHINIPAKPEIDDLELTDEQLEMVAGGDFVIIPGAVIAGIATVSLIFTAYHLIKAR